MRRLQRPVALRPPQRRCGSLDGRRAHARPARARAAKAPPSSAFGWGCRSRSLSQRRSRRFVRSESAPPHARAVSRWSVLAPFGLGADRVGAGCRENPWAEPANPGAGVRPPESAARRLRTSAESAYWRKRTVLAACARSRRLRSALVPLTAIVVHVTRPGRRASEPLAAVADHLGRETQAPTSAGTCAFCLSNPRAPRGSVYTMRLTPSAMTGRSTCT
jgi:hypothetical protein